MTTAEEGESGQRGSGARSAPKPTLFGGFLSAAEGPKVHLQPYLPTDLVGGSIPYIPGAEDEGVWNAAAQSCGTDRVHYCYTISEGRVWYLASPSSSLSSNPDSWCPLAAALPGNSEFWDKQTVYLYEQEGAAGALRWEAETGRLQIFLGASRTILPRIQSMEANFVTINPEAATPVPWRNRALRQEMLSRLMVKGLLFSGIGVALISLLIWLGAYMTANVMAPELEKAKQATAKATEQLMINALMAQQSNTSRYTSRMLELFNAIGSFGGVLVRFEVKSGDVFEWEALIPPAVDAAQLGAVTVQVENDGRIRIRGTR